MAEHFEVIDRDYDESLDQYCVTYRHFNEETTEFEEEEEYFDTEEEAEEFIDLKESENLNNVTLQDLDIDDEDDLIEDLEEDDYEEGDD